MSDGADAIQQVNAVANDNGAAHPVLVINAAVQGALAARPEAARPAAAPRGPPQDRPVHRDDERGVAGLHFAEQLGRDAMTFAERGRHADERSRVAGVRPVRSI